MSEEVSRKRCELRIKPLKVVAAVRNSSRYAARAVARRFGVIDIEDEHDEVTVDVLD